MIDLSIIRPIISLLEFLNVQMSPLDAGILITIIIWMSFVVFVLKRLNKMERRIVVLDDPVSGRMKMHSVYFKILTNDVKSAKDKADKANDISIDVSAKIDTIIAVSKKRG